MDERDQFEPVLKTPFDEFRLLQAVSQPNGARGALELLRWHDLLHQPLWRRDNNQRPACRIGELPENGRALDRGLQIKRQLLVWQGIWGRPQQHVVAGKVLREVRCQTLRAICSRCHNQRRSVLLRNRSGSHRRACSRRKVHDINRSGPHCGKNGRDSRIFGELRCQVRKRHRAPGWK